MSFNENLKTVLMKTAYILTGYFVQIWQCIVSFVTSLFRDHKREILYEFMSLLSFIEVLQNVLNYTNACVRE